MFFDLIASKVYKQIYYYSRQNETKRNAITFNFNLLSGSFIIEMRMRMRMPIEASKTGIQPCVQLSHIVACIVRTIAQWELIFAKIFIPLIEIKFL